MDVLDILAKLNLPGSSITVHRATREDLPAIGGLLVNDPLGRTREAASGAYDFRPHETEAWQAGCVPEPEGATALTARVVM